MGPAMKNKNCLERLYWLDGWLGRANRNCVFMKLRSASEVNYCCCCVYVSISSFSLFFTFPIHEYTADTLARFIIEYDFIIRSMSFPRILVPHKTYKMLMLKYIPMQLSADVNVADVVSYGRLSLLLQPIAYNNKVIKITKAPKKT